MVYHQNVLQMFLLVEQLTKDGMLPKIYQTEDDSKWASLKRKHQVCVNPRRYHASPDLML